MIAEQGRLAWQIATDYGRRSLAETTMGRYKSLIGPRLRARGFAGQQTEAAIGVAVLIGDLPLGRSATEACGQISSFAATNRTVEFDTEADVETFYVADAYRLFYLRCSPKLAP
jgi:hypothetical protein